MPHDKVTDRKTEAETLPKWRGISDDPMGDAEYRLAGLRHAMGFCVVSIAVTFQLGVVALGLGHEVLGFSLAGMTAMAVFALMAGWRSYDLSSGKCPDMGILFLAYQEGREIVTRVVTRILAIVAIAESVTYGLIPLAVITLLISIAVTEADKFIVIASYRGYENQTIDDASIGDPDDAE